MTAWARSLMKSALENNRFQVAAFARQQLFLRQCRRDAALTAKVARMLEIRPLDTSRPLPNKPDRSKTLFILAGGASVNQLTAHNLETMAQETSIGINFWPIHVFVPNALSTETDSEPGEASASNLFLTKEVNSPRIKRKLPEILVLRPPWPPNKARLYSLSEEYDARSWLYGRANVITKSSVNLATDLHRIVKMAIHRRLPSSVLPDNGSSVVRLTFWGLIQGYDEIVWVGVDQDSGPYFWTEEPIPPNYELAARLFPRDRGQPHSTSSSENRPFSNDVFLRALANCVGLVPGRTIYVAHSHSSLSDSIPTYPWESETTSAPCATNEKLKIKAD